MDIIKMILGSPVGSLGFVLGIMLGAGWIIYFVTKKVTEMGMEHNGLKGGFSKLETGLDDRLKKVETNVDEIRRDMSYIRGTIDVIQSGKQPVTKARSPISLTDVGKQLSIEIGAEMMINNNWDAIKKLIDTGVLNKNAYDIQEFCMEMAAVEPEGFLLPKDLEFLKTFAYRNGNALQYYSGIFGVMIRDKYFEAKGIDVNDVDVNDPAKQ